MTNFDSLQKTFKSTLDKFAPLRKKIATLANHF